MLIVFRSLPKVSDSRISRIGDLCRINDEVVKYITFEVWKPGNQNKWWFRNKKDSSFIRIIKYIFFISIVVPSTIIRLRKNLREIVFMDIDVALFAHFVARIFSKSIITLDIVDPIAYTKFKNIRILHPAIIALEAFISKSSNHTILPLAQREKLYSQGMPRAFEFENVPAYPRVIDINDRNLSNNAPLFDIGYFGTLDRSGRGILDLIDVCCRKKYRLLIAGSGNLSKYLSEKEFGKDIVFLGSYLPENMSKLYEQVKFSFAFYENDSELHKIAAPNKFYEHLAFETPIICSSNIPQALSVYEKNTGIVINNVEELENIEIKDIDIYIMKTNCRKEWDLKYQNYLDQSRKRWIDYTSK